MSLLKQYVEYKTFCSNSVEGRKRCMFSLSFESKISKLKAEGQSDPVPVKFYFKTDVKRERWLYLPARFEDFYKNIFLGVVNFTPG